MHDSDEQAAAALDAYLQEVQAGGASSHEKLIAEHPQLAGMVQCLNDLHQLAAGDDDLAPTIALPGAKQRSIGAPLPQLDRYEVEGEIGRGGMGVVYRARQLDLDRPVALKMILSGALASREHLDRFRDEARLAARLQHPNIVSIYEVGEVLGQPYFAMQYIGGPSLARRLQHGPLAPEEAGHLVAGIALAVEHLHQNGFIHRDLKPSNILLDGEGRPYVTDFGLVKMLVGDSNKTSTGVIVGTPSYMAPEQATAGRKLTVGPCSDIYSLGAILYEALTGRPPFQEATPFETLVQVIESEPLPPRQVRSAIPADLELICLRCLEKEPSARYPSAAALAADLGRFLKGEPVEAKAATPVQLLMRWSRREPALAAHLGTLGIFTLIAQLSYNLDHTDERVTLGFHSMIMAILAAWAGVSFVCQIAMRRPAWSENLRFIWIWLDIGFFTLLLHLDHALAEPVVVGYPLMIAAAGLWFRDSLVWFTTFMCILSYGLLMWLDWEEIAHLHKHAMFLVSLAVTGFIVAYQVRRVRALSRFYEHRSLG